MIARIRFPINVSFQFMIIALSDPPYKCWIGAHIPRDRLHLRKIVAIREWHLQEPPRFSNRKGWNQADPSVRTPPSGQLVNLLKLFAGLIRLPCPRLTFDASRALLRRRITGGQS